MGNYQKQMDIWLKVFGFSALACFILFIVMTGQEDATSGAFFWGGLMLVSLCIAMISVVAYNVAKNNNDIQRKTDGEETEKTFEKLKISFLSEAKIKYDKIATDIELPTNPKRFRDIQYWILEDKLFEMKAWSYYADEIEKMYGIFYNDIMSNKKGSTISVPYTVIPIMDIKYFAKEGDLQYQTKISGGGGGGSKLKGAVIGGVLAGDAGAVIGSRNKIEAIKSETITLDTRNTILKYFTNGSLTSKSYAMQLFDIFEELIPDKEYNIVVSKEAQIGQQPKIQPEVEKPTDIKDKLKKLIELKDEKLITDEEYIIKRQNLLAEL